MTLPEITLPKVELPFDIPVLLHPLTDHFIIAIPVVILLLEIMNLMMKKKAVGGVSFFLILLTIVAAVGAYFTGLVDGKEAFPALGEAAKTALTEHKLLGTYVMLASGVVLLFKLISMMTGSKIIKTLYLLVLIAFVLALFKQGKEGGELVYTHGMNVKQVKVLDDELFDLKDELEDAVAEIEEAAAETAKKVTVEEVTIEKTVKVLAPAVVVEKPTVQAETPSPSASEVVPAVTTPAQSPIETTGVEAIGSTVEENVQEVEKAVAIPLPEEIPTPQ